MNTKQTFDSFKKFSYYPELILLASFLFCILNLNLMAFDAKMSMHLAHSFEWLQMKPQSWLGPEVADFSIRLAPIYYWIVGGFWTLVQSIEGLIFVHVLLSFLCFYLLMRELKKSLTFSAICLWSLLFLFTPTLFVSIRRLENASLLNAFCSLLFLAALKYQKDRNKKWIWFASVVAFFAVQFHLAGIIPYIAFMALVFFNTENIKISKTTFFCLIWFFAGLALLPILEEFTYLVLPVSYLVTDMYERFFFRQRLFKYAFLSISICFTLFNFFYAAHNFWKQSQMGRTFYFSGISSEMTLKMKKFIYSMHIPEGSDPFAHVHGRAVNQMRREEMNSTQTLAYFGLYQSLFNNPISYDHSLIEKRPDSSWLFQLRNQQEIAIGADLPFLMTELKPQSLPQNTMIKYLDEHAEGIEKTRWNNSNLILPLAFLNHPEQIKIVRLEFEIDSQTDKYLNLLMDTNPTYRLLQVKINSKVQTTFEEYPGSLTQQSQYIYKISDRIDHAKVVVELKVLTEKIPNYSRLDIFTSGYVLASEF